MLAAGLVALSGALLGQTNRCATGSKGGTIACLIPEVYTQAGSKTFGSNLVLPSLNVPTGDSLLISPLTAAVPIPSPASGAVYSYNGSLGTYQRAPESFGPILAERAETVGKRNFSFGFAFQRFVFDNVDGQSVHNLVFPQAFQTSSADTFPGIYNFSMSLNQFTVFGSYGITDHLDVAVAVPINSVKLGLDLRVVQNSTSAGTLGEANGTQTATGLGDVRVQVKDTIFRGERAAAAIGLAIRTPTGDAYNALGSGAIGIKPFVAASYAFRPLSPHVNVGYEWNGRSVLMGNVLTGDKAEIPKQLSYAAGFDSSFQKHLTVSFDVIGRELFNAPRLVQSRPIGTFPQSSFAMTDGSVGFKLNPVGSLLLGFNLLFRMNDAGLRSKVSPLFSLAYTL